MLIEQKAFRSILAALASFSLTAITPLAAPSAETASTANISELKKIVADSEYEIRWQDRATALQSPNRAQNLRFTYFTDGFTAERRAPETPDDLWSVSLYVADYGKGARRNLPDVAELRVEKKRAHTTGQRLTIEYSNEPEGMRQNFLVHSSTGDGPLEIRLGARLQGVQMAVDETESFVYFHNGIHEVMRYSDLNVWDAKGVQLPALPGTSIAARREVPFAGDR